MDQSVRTIAYVGVAIALGIGAFFSAPNQAETISDETVEEMLFPKFTEPETAASLTITKFNEEKSDFDEFSVVRKGKVWAIPSHNDYPADAKTQMVDAALAVMDLKVASALKESADAESRQRYGVMEPTLENLAQSGSDAVGTHVVMRDAKNEPLADFIIGKAVPEKSNLRYVAIPGQNRILTVKIEADKLSTKFKDWIETDLLKIGSVWDISKLALADYTIYDAEQGLIEERARMEFGRDQQNAKWKIDQLEEYNGKAKKWEPKPPAKDEELNQQAIDDARSALNELKIVNVNPKPKSFKEGFLSGKLTRETAYSLASKGFYLFVGEEGGQQKVDLKSTDGELVVTMNDGVEYVLRFGKVADVGTAETKPGDAKDGKPAESKTSLERYLFVMAQYNADVLEKPKLEKMPGEKEEKPAPAADATKTPGENKPDDKDKGGDKKDAEKQDHDDAGNPDRSAPKPPNGDRPEGEHSDNEKSGDKPTTDKPDADKPATDKPEDGKPEDGKPEDKKGADEKSGDADKKADADAPKLANAQAGNVRLAAYQADGDKAAADKPAADKPAAADKSATDEKSPDAKPADPKPADAKPQDGQAAPGQKTGDDKPAGEKPAGDKPVSDKPAGDKPADAKGADGKPAVPTADAPKGDEAAKQLDAERKRIEAENKRKQDEYDNKVKAAKKKVKELNERFGDWYYVIPEDVYKKIHLNRAAVIKKIEKAADPHGDGHDHGAGDINSPIPFNVPGTK